MPARTSTIRQRGGTTSYEPPNDVQAHEDEAAADWFAACHRLTARVERTGRWSALLDLGTCTDAEAIAALRGPLDWLAAAGFQPMAGIAPSAALAQLTLLSCTPQRPLSLLSPAETPAFLKRVPVAALLHLHPHGLVTPEVVERLQRYGLRTLGHVARIGELALRRQFGAAGGFLAALVQGRDARPLCPTPLPPELRIRARFAVPVTFEELLAALPRLAERAAERLCAQGRQARSLRLVVRWESGAMRRCGLTLRQYTDSPTLLAQELRRLATSADCAAGDCPNPPTPFPKYREGGTRAGMGAVGARPASPATCAGSDVVGVGRTPLHGSHLPDAGSCPVADARGSISADFGSSAWCAGTSVPRAPTPTPSHCSASEIACRDRVEELRLTLADFAPSLPGQATFWRTRAQQATAIEQVAETLTRRHGRPLLLRPRVAVPAAIFDEERYRFTAPGAPLPDAVQGRPAADVADIRTSRVRARRPAQRDVAEMGETDADGDDAWRDVPQRVHWW